MTTELYTKDGCLPRILPEMIQLSDGNIKGDRSTYTDEEIADAGWTLAPIVPQIDRKTHKVSWNATTIDWDTVPLSEEEIANNHAGIWNGIRHERNERLAVTDYIVLRAYETAAAIPTEWADYRQALRDIPSAYEDENDIVWPTEPE